MSAQITSFLKLVFPKVLDPQNVEKKENAKSARLTRINVMKWSRELMQLG